MHADYQAPLEVSTGGDLSLLRGYRAEIPNNPRRPIAPGRTLKRRSLVGVQSPPTATMLAPADSVALAGWGLNVTGASLSPFTGRGIKIALLDSGFLPSHPDFKSRRIFGHSFVPGETPLDRVGHGTHCGAVACGPPMPASHPRYGVAGAAEMLVFKVLGPNGSLAPPWVEAGIEMAIAHRCEIVCVPIAKPVSWDAPYELRWENLAQRALAAGTLILAATGNDSKRHLNRQSPVGSPANCPSIVAVGAVDTSLRIADFSNGGSPGGVDLVAPGVDIFSAHLAPGFYRLMSGTSQAVAMTAGIAALHAEKTGLRGSALRAELERTARPLPLNPTEVGAGLVQAPL